MRLSYPIFREDIVQKCSFRNASNDPVYGGHLNKCFFCSESVARWFCRYGGGIAEKFAQAYQHGEVLSTTSFERYLEIIHSLLFEQAYKAPSWLEAFIEEAERWRHAFPFYPVKRLEAVRNFGVAAFERPRQYPKQEMRVGKKKPRITRGFPPKRRPRTTNWDGFLMKPPTGKERRSKRVSWVDAEVAFFKKMLEGRK